MVLFQQIKKEVDRKIVAILNIQTKLHNIYT